LRTDCAIVRHPDSYSDKRGAKFWTEVTDLLAKRCTQPSAATDAA
jgi:hypothetical protein